MAPMIPRSSQSPPSSSRSGGSSSKSLSQTHSAQSGSRRGSPTDPSSLTLDVHNLLGPTVANAFKLFDEKDRPGIFFVFQDLSVRTEGKLVLFVYEFLTPPHFSALYLHPCSTYVYCMVILILIWDCPPETPYGNRVDSSIDSLFSHAQVTLDLKSSCFVSRRTWNLSQRCVFSRTFSVPASH